MPAHIKSPIPDEKLRQLDQLIREGRTIDVCQVIIADWPQPTGTRYYAKTRFDLAPNFVGIPWKPIEARILNTSKDHIEAIKLSTSYEVSGDTIQLSLVDTDQHFRELFADHKQGCQIHIWQYIPQIDCPVEVWWGWLDPPGSVQDGLIQTSATFGMRSPLQMFPGRVMSVTTCHAAPFFGGSLKTQEQIDRGGCPYNVHIGGNVGNIAPGGGFYTDCEGESEDACFARIGGDRDGLPILRFSSILGSETVQQTKGANTLATTRGNESNLNVPCPVVAGTRILRQLPPLTFQVQSNRKHPEKGTVSAIFPVSDSSVESLSEPAINDTSVTNAPGTTQNQFLYNLGKQRQKGLNLTGTQKAANYANVAHWRGLIFGDFKGQSASSFSGKIKCVGNNEIYRWTGANKGTIGYSENRLEFIYWALTNLRAGCGEPEGIFEPLDWEVGAAECAEDAGYADASGNHFKGPRSTIHAQLEGRKADEQIRDLCLGGRLTAPYMFSGKKRIHVLKKEVIDSSIPVFTDVGPNANIEPGSRGNRSILIEQKKPHELFNFIKVWFEDVEYEYVRRPLIFVYKNLIKKRLEIGATPLNPTEINLLGVVNFGEAVRVGQMYGDLGAFDSGGVENNCRITFKAMSVDPRVLVCHPYCLIRVVSPELRTYRESSGRPVEYFRVLNMEHGADWRTTITAQAYPVDYMERMENAELPPLKKGSAGVGALPEVVVAG